MPELPEVETVRKGLSELIVGKSIAGVNFDTPKSFPNAPKDVQEFLIGARILEVKRRAKVLIIEFDTKYSLIIHLKMTGQLVYVGEQRSHQSPVISRQSLSKTGDKRRETSDSVPVERFGAGHPNNSLIGVLPDKSTRVIFEFNPIIKDDSHEASARKQRSTEGAVQVVQRESTGAADAVIVHERWQSFGLGLKAGQRADRLFFNDQRKFGWVRLVPTAEIPNIDFFKKVGPEPLASDFTPADFKQRLLRRKNSGIKAVLLDQTVIAGVGNIYADESLWGAKIHPETKVIDISSSKITALYHALRDVLELSIAKGGSSDRNYVDAKGKPGSYLNFANVFRREGKACPRCGQEIIKTRVAGRGTHTCPYCQKQPKTEVKS